MSRGAAAAALALALALPVSACSGTTGTIAVDLLARRLGIARGDIAVIAGASSRRKTLRIERVTRAQLDALIEDRA